MSTEATRIDSGPGGTMSSASKHKFPPVRFDITLHDLFAEGIDRPLTDTFCVAKPNSDPGYGDIVPFNKKYIIHSAQVGNPADLAHMCLEINSYLLMFYAGPMDIALVGAEGRADDETLTRAGMEASAIRSFSVIDEKQRPKIHVYANPEDLVKRHNTSSNIRWAFAMDFTETLPSVNNAEHVYKLNSKRWLGSCPLKSANDDLIDCKIECPDHMTEDNLWYFGGLDCRLCGSGIEAEVHRIRYILWDRPPYVLKLTQSLSSVGTLIVKDEQTRKDVINQIDKYLRDYLPRVTKENAHLLTTSLIMSDLIPGETMALNFFVKRDGSVEFLGACHQQSTGETGRQATAITYADQEKLQKKYQSTLDEIGRVLHEENYFGPVGADIMENPDDHTLFTIDLNVRSPLSMVLYVIRSHLNKERGHSMSIVYECIMLTVSREEFESRFEKEMEEAKIILMGSTKLGKKSEWAYGVIVSGGSQDDIDRLSNAILELEVEDGQAAEAAG